MFKVLQAIIIKELYGKITPSQSSGISNLTLLQYAMIILLTLGVIGTLAGSFMLFETYYSLPMAILLTSGVMIALAGICGLITLGTKFYKYYKFKRLKSEITDTLQDVIETANDNIAHLTDPIKDNPSTAVIVAALAGYMTGNKLI